MVLLGLTGFPPATRADVSTLVPLGSYTNVQGDMFEAVAVRSNLVYVSNGLKGLQIVDVSDPAHPVRLGGVQIPPDLVRGIDVMGDFAVLAGYWRGVQIVDCSDPQTPTLKSTVNWRGGKEVHIIGHYAHIVTDYTVGTLDLSTPDLPVVVGERLHFTELWGSSCQGTRLFVAEMLAGLSIIDVSDPTNRVVIGTCSYHSPNAPDVRFFDAAADGDRAWLLSGSSEGAFLDAFNIADPAKPVHIGRAALPATQYYLAPSAGSLTCVSIGGSLIHLAGEDLLSPRLTSSFRSTKPSQFSRRPVVVDGKVYWPDGFAGLVIFSVEPAPLLAITPRASAGGVRVDWGNTPGTRLQFTRDLRAPDWKDVSEATGQSGVELPAADGAAFFRALR